MNKTGSSTLWKASSGLVGTLIVLAILVAANVIIGHLRVRKDLTANKLYTLSPGTRHLLTHLDRDVKLRLYVNSGSPDVPVYVKDYARKVEDLLDEYRIVAKGRVTVEKYDPTPDSDAEEMAQRYGIAGQPADMFGPPVYFGLVAISDKTEAVLPVLDPKAEGLLEYSITRMIYRSVHPEKPVVGVMSSLPVLGAPMQFMMPGQPRPQPWVAFQQLKEDYDVREIAPFNCAAIDPAVSSLIVVHPKDLPPETLFALDQFVLRGGRLLVLADPLSVADMESSPQSQFQRPSAASDLAPLFKAWGVAFDPGKVVADLRAASSQNERGPFLLALTSDHFNRTDIISSQLNLMWTPYAGAFTVTPRADLTVVPLVTSSDAVGLMNAMTAQFGGASAMREFKKEPIRQNLAVRLTGKFKTAFPDGKPAEDDKDKNGDTDASKPKPEAKTASLKEGSSTVILVGDADILVDRFCIREGDFFGYKTLEPVNDNLAFFLNAVEQISGSSDLIGIRSRGQFRRPFDRVVALEEDARLKWQDMEKDLMQKFEDTRKRLDELQAKKDQNQRFILSPGQKEAIAALKKEELRIKDDLKKVRKNLRQDIERLGMKVKLANIVLMPALVTLAGIVYGVRRRHRH